ncbi:hypothetical protein QTN25_002932 [Entamoeba marina]
MLDSYSLLIASKYFNTNTDFINAVCVCKKFKDTTEKLRFNPIPIKSLKLFPQIQTQYLFSKNDTKINGIDNYEIWYEVDYDQYLLDKNDNIKYHYINYTKTNRICYGSTIPNTVNTLDIKCFSECTFNTIEIPNTINSIQTNCFVKCLNLESVALPNTITKISDWCFHNCSSLKIINIPLSVQSIGSNCFQQCKRNDCFSQCTSLQSFIVPSSIKILKRATFNNCRSLNKIELPTTLISIGKWCFNYCTSLTKIFLPPSLKHIGKESLNGCGFLLIEIPNSIKSIGIESLNISKPFLSIKLPSNVHQLTSKVSYYDSLYYKQNGIECKNVVLTQKDTTMITSRIKLQHTLTEFVIPNGVTSIIDFFAFALLNKYKSVIIPTTVTLIDSNSFANCKSLTSISIPNSIKLVKMNCFKGCDNLKQLSLPLNENNKYPFKVSYNDYLLFKQCGIDCERVVVFNRDSWFKYKAIPTNLPLILDLQIKSHETTISNNIISIKSSYLSKDITSIIIPTNVSYLCDECFKDYIELNSISIPTTIKYIGKHIIDGCTSLTNIEYDGDWNNIVVSYNDHLRYNRNGLIFNSIEYTKEDMKTYGNVIPSIIQLLHRSCYERSSEMFHIPTHIISLDNHMFGSYIYSSIKRITIPTSITLIPKYCFAKCKLLTYISLPFTITSIKRIAFEKCISLQSIVIPTSLISIEKYAFKYCYSLTSITLPTTLQTVGTGCFEGCYQLKSILNIPDKFFN